MPKGGALPGKGDPQAGNGVVVQGEGGPHKFSGFPVHTGDEDVAAPTLPHSGGNAADLLRGLARPVNDLCRPLADTPVEVHLGVAQIRKGLGFELQQRVLRRGAPVGHGAQQVENLVLVVHGLSSSVRALPGL